MKTRVDRPVYRVGAVEDEAILLAEPAAVGDGANDELYATATAELRARFHPGMLVTIEPLILLRTDERDEVGS